MKKLVGLGVVIATLILGGYYGMGVITERTLKKNIVMINQSNGLTIEVVKYDRGWCHSKALLNWSMHIPARTVTNDSGQTTTAPAQDYQMQMPLDIDHGPMMIVDSKPLFGLGFARSEIVLPKPYAEQFASTFTAQSTQPVLHLGVFVSYLNDSTLRMRLPTFKLISKDGNSQFEWLGMSSDINISSGGNNVNGHVAFEGINWLKDQVNAALGHVTSDYDLHRTNLDLYLGNANLTLPSLHVTQGDKSLLDVEKLNVHSSSDIKEGLFNSNFKATLSKLLTNDKIYGPALLDVSIQNLDAAVLAKMNDQANAMQQGSDVQPNQVMLSLMPELPKLLSKGAKFEVSELSLAMPEGIIKGTLVVSLPSSGVDNPFQLIQKIQGQGKFVFSAAVMKQLVSDSIKHKLQQKEPGVLAQDIDQQASAQLAAMVQSGLLSLQGSDYVIEFKLAEGQLSVNAKPFNSAMMKF